MGGQEKCLQSHACFFCLVPARAWSCFSLQQHQSMARQQPRSPLRAFTSAFAICLARFLSYGEGMSERDNTSWLQLSRGRSAIAGLSCHLCEHLGQLLPGTSRCSAGHCGCTRQSCRGTGLV